LYFYIIFQSPPLRAGGGGGRDDFTGIFEDVKFLLLAIGSGFIER
jgi:hypothetical protein